MVLHQQFLFIVFCHSQLLLQLGYHLFLFINHSHQSFVTFLYIPTLLHQSTVILSYFTLLAAYSLHLLICQIQQVLQLLLILHQTLIQLRIFLDSLEDVPAYVLIFVDFLPDEVQLTR